MTRQAFAQESGHPTGSVLLGGTKTMLLRYALSTRPWKLKTVAILGLPSNIEKPGYSLLEVREDGQPSRTNFESPIELQHYYSQPETANAAKVPRRRIHILEGLNLEFISILGNQFSIDPAFFVD
jgi:hypothetical protein